MSHQFSLNGNPSDPDCHGIPGILAAYHQCINSVQLYGPTNASPIIGNVAKMAREVGLQHFFKNLKKMHQFFFELKYMISSND